MHRPLKIFGIAIMIVSGVSVVTNVQAKSGNTMKFNWSNAYLSYLKEKPRFSYKKNKKKLTKLFYPHVYDKYENNEFQLNGKEKKSVSKVKSKVDSLKTPLFFKINTSSKFGKYNFKKHEFPFQPFSKTSYFHASGYCNPICKQQVDLLISNASLIQKISMSKANAKKLVDSRTGPDGNINRQVHLKLRFKITGAKSKRQSPTNDPSLIGKIVKATAYAGKRQTHKLQTWSG